MEVEDLPHPVRQKLASRARSAKTANLTEIDKVRRFPYGLKHLV